ncbi:IS21 family transposase [Fusibacter ferrireducens]|uniref:IS21 family transposase n=1 Tax=Fusibacter ferrireducens TaxID=2785058 RepID=A0ABR9ZP46_9FIRM|nr:IS21 family transposase [Fusibacter ferrireducens]MBF4692243.1 IS21 family transposase [Fusibacter ferrireducens]
MITLMDKYTIIKLKQTGMSNRYIARQLGINRKTVNRYWNEHLANLKSLKDSNTDNKTVQEKMTSAPVYDVSNRSAYKYTSEIDHALDQILASEKEKLKVLGLNKQQLTNVQIHQELVSQGFDIGKTTISTKIKEKRNRIKECFIRQEYNYGERLEFDFGEVKLVINQEVVKYHLAVLSSPAANFRWCYLYNNQTKEVFLDAHVKFFEMVKGVYREVVYDNMKNVVSKFIGKTEKLLNEDLVKMSLYYGFDINVTNCFSGNEKGHVEGSVKVLRNKIFGPRYKFESLEAAIKYMDAELIKLNQNTAIELEKSNLLPYKPILELADIRKLTVDKYSFARIDNNFYSVPDYLVGKTITAKIYHTEIEFYSNNHLVCTHKKIDGSKEISIDIRHYLRTFERKPGAVRNSLALKSMPVLKSIYDIYFKTNPKKFIEILKENQDKSIDAIIEVFRLITENQLMTSSNTELAKVTMNQLRLYNNLTFKEVRQ